MLLMKLPLATIGHCTHQLNITHPQILSAQYPKAYTKAGFQGVELNCTSDDVDEVVTNYYRALCISVSHCID
jgi:hypothetical protein